MNHIGASWSEVDIDALRGHLMEMRLVMTDARVEVDRVARGARFRVTGDPDTLQAAKRMLPAHSAMLRSEMPAWITSVTTQEDSVTWLLEAAPEADLDEVARIRGLGFYGALVLGNHHAPHHLMIAKGSGH